MAQIIQFTKMVATGNDFVVIDRRGAIPKQSYCDMAQQLCHRQYGIGADGLLVIEDSHAVDFRMRIINPDGSEVAMCGNGVRCAARFVAENTDRVAMKIETGAGVYACDVHHDEISVTVPAPTDMRFSIDLSLADIHTPVNYINTGVPHVVVFVDDLDGCDVARLGKKIRYHAAFSPEGANVNFVQVVTPAMLYVRTYERGVENETLACGTGAMAAACMAGCTGFLGDQILPTVTVKTKSGERILISYRINKGIISDLCFAGAATIVFCGEIVL